MKGIGNRQKKVVTPKSDFKKDPSKFKTNKKKVKKKEQKRHT